MPKKEKDAKDPKEKIKPIYVRLSPEDMPRFDRIRKARGLKAATLVKEAVLSFMDGDPEAALKKMLEEEKKAAGLNLTQDERDLLNGFRGLVEQSPEAAGAVFEAMLAIGDSPAATIKPHALIRAVASLTRSSRLAAKGRHAPGATSPSSAKK